MKVALVGNQNCGKSTLFNTLTGSNQKIGNWPGVTVEKKSGIIRNTDFELVDLPGVYSLNSYTKEEEITNNFLCSNQTDVIINVLDCNSISRGLYLTSQLIDKFPNVLILLNMYEIAERKGIKIDENKLSEKFGNIPVIKISAISGYGIEAVIKQLKAYNLQLKGNEKSLAKKLSKRYEETEEEISKRYEEIDKILQYAVTFPKEIKNTVTDTLDKIFLHKIFAIPIFAGIMFFIYYISIEIIGNLTISKMNNFFEWLSQIITEFLLSNGAKEALNSLIVDGILHGVSAVISFLPQLAFLFMMIAILEKIGYMSRISLIFDKLFRKIGISGNSVISFILGTGCSVPGIMATRTIKNEKQRTTTAVLTPFIPCSAKLPMVSLFSSYFFENNAGIIALSFYFLSIMIIIFSALLFKNIKKKDIDVGYVAELPEYRLPKWKQIIKDTFEKVLDFVKRAGSVILISSIAVWLLSSYSIKLEYGVEVQESILADVGRCFSWIFVPMVGENRWEIAVSSIQGLIAKEQVISSMAVIAGLENRNVSNNIFANGSPFNFFTPLSAYIYVCFNLFSAPCFGAISAMKRTLGGTKNAIKAVLYQTVISYIISCMIYQIGSIIV